MILLRTNAKAVRLLAQFLTNDVDHILYKTSYSNISYAHLYIPYILTWWDPGLHTCRIIWLMRSTASVWLCEVNKIWVFRQRVLLGFYRTIKVLWFSESLVWGIFYQWVNLCLMLRSSHWQRDTGNARCSDSSEYNYMTWFKRNERFKNRLPMFALGLSVLCLAGMLTTIAFIFVRQTLLLIFFAYTCVVMIQIVCLISRLNKKRIWFSYNLSLKSAF